MFLYQNWLKETPSNHANKKMLIIGMSATASTREQDEGFECGMHLFFSKPLDFRLLQIVLNSVRETQSVEECILHVTKSVDGVTDVEGDDTVSPGWQHLFPSRPSQSNLFEEMSFVTMSSSGMAPSSEPPDPRSTRTTSMIRPVDPSRQGEEALPHATSNDGPNEGSSVSPPGNLVTAAPGKRSAIFRTFRQWQNKVAPV